MGGWGDGSSKQPVLYSLTPAGSIASELASQTKSAGCHLTARVYCIPSADFQQHRLHMALGAAHLIKPGLDLGLGSISWQFEGSIVVLPCGARCCCRESAGLEPG